MGRRRRSTMSDQLKNELAKDLGFYDTVQKEGWGGIKAKDAGNMSNALFKLPSRLPKKSGLSRHYKKAEADRALAFLFLICYNNEQPFHKA